jgi:hypothetical protein
MNNAKKGECYCANLSCFYLPSHPLRLVLRLAINFPAALRLTFNNIFA